MYNRVILIGHLASDPEARATQNGTPVTNLRLATNTYAGTDETGTRKETTDFHTIVVFGKPAEAASSYLQKGWLVHLEGKLHHRSWEGSDGQKRTTSEIVADSFLMLGARPTAAGAG